MITDLISQTKEAPPSLSTSSSATPQGVESMMIGEDLSLRSEADQSTNQSQKVIITQEDRIHLII